MPRFNVDFNEEATRVLEDLADAQGTTKADVLRKAIALEKWFNETLQSGSKIVVEAPDGKLREILKF